MINLSDKLTSKTVDKILCESTEIRYNHGDVNPHCEDTVSSNLNRLNDEINNFGDGFYKKQEDILIEEDGIYQIKDAMVYPVSHPDLSTQPSILPQRYGNLPIKEVLIANGREYEIPGNATVINAFSFNNNQCVAAFVEKNGNTWSIRNDKRVIPEFTLVSYIGDGGNDSYYYYGSGSGGGGNVKPKLLCTLTMNNGQVIEVRGNGSELTQSQIRNYDYQNIKSAVISDNVATIGSNAFDGCRSLAFIYIPNSVTSIGTYAFIGCSGLASVTIPNSVTSIGGGAFQGCTSLSSITIPDSVTSIGGYAFYGCTSLASITIPDSVITIEYSAFSYCTGLTSITIPDSVTSIGGGAFYGCTGLTSFTIGNSVTSIGSYAFNNCSSLTSVTCLAENVPTTGAYAFNGVNQSSATLYVPSSSITAYSTADQWKKFVTIEEAVLLSGSCGANVNFKLYYGGELDIYGTGAMSDFANDSTPWNDYLSGVTSVVIENGVTTIGERSFRHCENLASATIPNSVTAIKNRAFSACIGLASVVIPNSVTSIEEYAFHSCANLVSVIIPNGVTSIGSGAFYKCSGLASVTIGNGIKSIPDYMFEECSNLSSVTIPNSVTSIGNHAFYRCTGLTSITIPNSVTTIGSIVFSECINLTSVTIPDSVKIIGNQIFYGCTGLTYVAIPNSLTSIGSGGFEKCNGLKTAGPIGGGYNIEFGWTTTIPKSAFFSCDKITSITIPNGVTSLGIDICAYCDDLKSITIPNSVTSIGRGAFRYCPALTSIVCHASTAPTIQDNTFNNIATNGTLYVPVGSTGYEVWMQNANYYLGKYGWTKVEQ